MSEPEQHPEDEQPHPEPDTSPLWQHPGLAVVAALVALLGLVWRCA